MDELARGILFIAGFALLLQAAPDLVFVWFLIRRPLAVREWSHLDRVLKSATERHPPYPNPAHSLYQTTTSQPYRLEDGRQKLAYGRAVLFLANDRPTLAIPQNAPLAASVCEQPDRRIPFRLARDRCRLYPLVRLYLLGSSAEKS